MVLDGRGRPLSDTDATNATVATTWDPVKDLPLSATGAAGRVTHVHDDAADRPTEVYGPAPASCFDANRMPGITTPLADSGQHPCCLKRSP